MFFTSTCIYRRRPKLDVHVGYMYACNLPKLHTLGRPIRDLSIILVHYYIISFTHMYLKLLETIQVISNLLIIGAIFQFI